MIYLHKSVFQSHGYLSSAKCHVDNRWVLKISGFSLQPFRKEDSIEQVTARLLFFYKLLYIFLQHTNAANGCHASEKILQKKIIVEVLSNMA